MTITKDIQTPFGPARLNTDGRLYVHLNFEDFKLGRCAPVRGSVTLYLDGDTNPDRGPYDVFSTSGVYQAKGFCRAITDAQRKAVNTILRPWLQSYADAAEGFDDAALVCAEREVERCDDDIAKLEEQLAALRVKREELVAARDELAAVAS